MMHRLLILILCTVLLTACGKHITSVVGVTDNTVDEALFTQGIEVYRENYCGLCHTLTIANTRGTFGPSHDDAVESAGRLLESGRYMGEAKSPIEYIEESILYPALFYTPGFEATYHHMPSFSHLPATDVEAMVYILVYQSLYIADEVKDRTF